METTNWILGCFLLLTLTNVDGYLRSDSQMWNIMNTFMEDGFEGDVTIPVTKTMSSWKSVIEFDRPVRDFKAFDAIVESWEVENQTRFVVGNEPSSKELEAGSLLVFSLMGFAKGGKPSMRLTFANKTYGRNRKTPSPKKLTRSQLRRISNANVNYQRALKLSLRFFESQKSGFANDTSVSWKGSSGLYDGGMEGFNLVGGYYIAGDYVKFNFPMAFAITQLAWGALEFSEGYETAGQMSALFKTVKWATDYFVKCHVSEFEYYGMVGDPDIDHKHWESSQSMTWERPAFIIDASNPGSDLVAETAAALAAASILFDSIAAEYSSELIKHAEQLFSFADNYRGRYDITAIPKAGNFYRSTGYEDELVWAAVWLYKATKKQLYLDFAENNYGSLLFDDYEGGLSYDKKLLGIQLLLADITGDYITYMNPALKFCDKPGDRSAFYLSNGLLYRNMQNGPIMFASNSAFLCSIVARRADNSARSKKYLRFVKNQINIILGAANTQSFMIGFGNNRPTLPYHRDSSCPSPPDNCGWEFFHDSLSSNSFALNGALVGGPDRRGVYEDARDNIFLNQPNILFNSAFQSAVAALITFDNGGLDSSGGGSGSLWDVQDFAVPASLTEFFSSTSINDSFDACISNPCQNDGKCKNVPEMDFECECSGNHYGTLCEQMLNPEIEWVSTWPNGAQIHIHLPGQMLHDVNELLLYFPVDCPLIYVEVWHSCLVEGSSSLQNRTVALQQFQWQVGQTFVGIKFEFDAISFARTCFNTADFSFQVVSKDTEDVYMSGITAFTCLKKLESVAKEDKNKEAAVTTEKPELLTIKPYVPAILTAATVPLDHMAPLDTSTASPTKAVTDATEANGSEFISWMNIWGSGGQGHINITDKKNDVTGSMVMKLLFPDDCKLTAAEFWHACTVEELNDPSSGLFVLHQVGWQVYHSFIGMTIHLADFKPGKSCFDPSLYSVSYEEYQSLQGIEPSSCQLKFESIDRDSKPEASDEATASKPRVWLPGSSLSSTASVTVKKLRAEVTSPNSVQLSWKRIKNVADAIQINYKPAVNNENNQTKNGKTIKLKSVGVSVVMNEIEIEVPMSRNKVSVQNLLPGYRYEFSVRAKTGNIFGPSSLITVTLAPSDIENIRTLSLNDTSLQFKWQKPEGFQEKYKVTYFPQSKNAFPKSPFEVNGDQLETAVSGLKAGNDYVFVFVVKTFDVMSDGKYLFVKAGFSECKKKKCGANSECVQIESGAECKCNIGYEWRSGKCQDINECKDKNACQKKAVCKNREGSYDCLCQKGYIGDGVSCHDVNECLMAGEPVCRNAICMNAVGSYTCACNKGYTLDQFFCKDIDECASESYNCPKDSVCKNTQGSYTCACANGFIFNEDHCRDINECRENTDDCMALEICVNTKGRYKCVCRKGMKLSEKKICEDIDECTLKSKCDPNAVCKNIIGGHRCRCKKGFLGSGEICKDADECDKGTHDCSASADCVNTEGSYSCKCAFGFTGDGKHCTEILDLYADDDNVEELELADPCKANSVRCDKNAKCIVKAERAKCVCNKGFNGNGKMCFDVNECRQRSLSKCDLKNGKCVNTYGSYRCQCNIGLRKDGDECVPEF